MNWINERILVESLSVPTFSKSVQCSFVFPFFKQKKSTFVYGLLSKQGWELVCGYWFLFLTYIIHVFSLTNIIEALVWRLGNEQYNPVLVCSERANLHIYQLKQTTVMYSIYVPKFRMIVSSSAWIILVLSLSSPVQITKQKSSSTLENNIYPSINFRVYSSLQQKHEVKFRIIES